MCHAAHILKWFKTFRKKFYLKLKREHIKLEMAPLHSAQNLLGKNSKGGDGVMATIIATPYTPFVYVFFSFKYILLTVGVTEITELKRNHFLKTGRKALQFKSGACL